MSVQNKSQRVAVLFHRVGPYHFARLRAVGRRMAITAIELCGKDNTYAWDPVRGCDSFERVTLFPSTDSRTEPTAEVVRRIGLALERCQPAAVALPGWSYQEALGGLQWCLRHRVPAIVMSESTEWDEPRAAHKEWAKRRIVQMCSAALAGGNAHADYLVKLGMPRERVFLGYDAVDNDYFARKTGQVADWGVKLRSELGLSERFFLASARFVEKKNLSRLLQAYALYRRQAEAAGRKPAPWQLVLLGDGPLKPALDSQLAGLNLRDGVRMPGFRQYNDLPAYYALASVFIHASTTEQWGLVVNEAMASGLPVLVSNRCGCAPDLVKEGVNGFTFEPDNTEQLADLMLRVTQGLTNGAPSGSGVDLAAMGQASRRMVAEWGPERFAEGLRGAVEVALKSPAPPAGWMERLLLKLLLLR